MVADTLQIYFLKIDYKFVDVSFFCLNQLKEIL